MKKFVLIFIISLIFCQFVKTQSDDEDQDDISNQVLQLTENTAQTYSVPNTNLTLWHIKDLYIITYEKMMSQAGHEINNQLKSGILLFIRILLSESGRKIEMNLDEVIASMLNGVMESVIQEYYDDVGDLKPNKKVKLNVQDEKYYLCVTKNTENEYYACINKNIENSEENLDKMQENEEQQAHDKIEL